MLIAEEKYHLMPFYYLDVKCDSGLTGKIDPKSDHILIIPILRINTMTGDAIDELILLEAYHSSETEILKEFLKLSQWHVAKPNPFHFVPVGYNLSYDLSVLYHRINTLLDITLDWEFLFRMPKIDLHDIVKIANRGKLKGASLSNYIERLYQLYDQPIELKENANLLEYTDYKIRGFLSLYQYFVRSIPEVIPEMNREVPLLNK